MAAKRTIGTVLKKGTTAVGGLTSITMPEKSRDSIETTTLDVTDDYKTFIPGLKDGGEVTVKGYFDHADTGQLALDTAFEAGTTDDYSIVFPAAIGVTFTFSAFLTKYAIGEVNLEDPLSFEATFKVDGKPELAATI